MSDPSIILPLHRGVLYRIWTRGFMEIQYQAYLNIGYLCTFLILNITSKTYLGCLLKCCSETEDNRWDWTIITHHSFLNIRKPSFGFIALHDCNKNRGVHSLILSSSLSVGLKLLLTLTRLCSVTVPRCSLISRINRVSTWEQWDSRKQPFAG